MPKPARKMTAGSYAGSTKPQVQGTGSNQSAADLRMMQASGANAGAALRKVAPVGGQSYEDFQRTRHSPQGQADKEAYEAANKLPRLTDADYQQRRFNEGAGQVQRMAQASPGSSVFSGAPLSAAFAGQRDQAARLGNYADTGGKAVTAASQADRLAKLPAQSAYVAPGVASGIVTKDLGDSTPMKKKMSGGPMIAKYADGTKGVQAGKPLPKKQPYQAKTQKDFEYRKQMYQDSLDLNTTHRDAPAASHRWKAEAGTKPHVSLQVDRMNDMMENASLPNPINPKIRPVFQYAETKPTANEDEFITTRHEAYRKPQQEVLPPKKRMKYAGGVKRVATSPFSEVDSEGEEQYDGTVNAPELPKTELDMVAARKMRVMPRELSADRDAGPKKPADYQEAAALIRSTPALKAQYKAGIASGKAFSLSIGGKTFKYAATPQKKAVPAPETVTGLPGGDIRKARMQEADEMSQVAVAKMATKRKMAATTPAKGAAESPEPGSTEENFAKYAMPQRTSPSGQVTKLDLNDKQVQYYPNGRMRGADGVMGRANDLPTSAQIKKRKMASRS